MLLNALIFKVSVYTIISVWWALHTAYKGPTSSLLQVSPKLSGVE